MKISIQSLEQGISRFSEIISPDFIEKPYKKFYPNDFTVHAEVDKFERDIRLKIVAKSISSFNCDSCLTVFEDHIEIQQQQLYEIGLAPEGANEDIIYLTPDTKEIDITSLLFEGVVLNHPIKMRCNVDCKGLCSGCGSDLNKEKCFCEEKDIDPRWEKLRNLIK